MLNILASLINGKKVLLLGFGKEGKAAYNLIKTIGLFNKLTIADMNPQPEIEGADTITGETYLDCIDNFDIAFKSPGIVLPKKINEYKCKITSQTEVFLQAFSKQVIGVTGTKGKSTVSSLIYHVLGENGVPCVFAGNIGIPMFEVYESIAPETIVVLELSCHQLENCKFSPAVSILLNIYEDHLDHYKTFENYAAAKKNIYLHQGPLDILFCDKSLLPLKPEALSRTIAANKDILPFKALEDASGAKLRGTHNLNNCAFVYNVAKLFDISDENFVKSISSFVPLHHRLEFADNINGIDFYDDSISTTVESTIGAVESIPNAATILIGGMDRGIDYTSLVAYLVKSKLSNIICMYKSGQRVYDMLKAENKIKPKIFYCDDLHKAVRLAKKVTKLNEACILSPAAASYGYFKNFEERGDVFKQLINEMI